MGQTVAQSCQTTVTVPSPALSASLISGVFGGVMATSTASDTSPALLKMSTACTVTASPAANDWGTGMIAVAVWEMTVTPPRVTIYRATGHVRAASRHETAMPSVCRDADVMAGRAGPLIVALPCVGVAETSPSVSTATTEARTAPVRL